MGAGRARRAARAHRCRRLLRQEQRAGLSRHESERPGADAGRDDGFRCGNPIRSCATSRPSMAPATWSRPISRRARGASSWMDWQISVVAPAITPVFWGLIRTPPEKRDAAAIEAGKVKSMAAMKILDAQLAKTRVRGRRRVVDGRYPGGLMAYRFRRWFRSGRRARQPRTLVHRHRATARVQGARRRWRSAFAVIDAHSCGSASAASPAPGNAALQRLAAQQLRHVADEAGGLADEKALQRRQAVDQAEADIAGRAAARPSDWRTAG